MSEFTEQNLMPNKFSSDGWGVLSPMEQGIKSKVERIGTPLKDWNITINYGVRTGVNEAFIIDGKTKDELIKKSPKSADVIRPIPLAFISTCRFIFFRQFLQSKYFHR